MVSINDTNFFFHKKLDKSYTFNYDNIKINFMVINLKKFYIFAESKKIYLIIK